MGAIGEDFRGGWFRRLYAPVNPAGLGRALLFAVALIVINQVLQLSGALALAKGLFGADSGNVSDFVKASLVAIFPVSLVTAACAWGLAGRRGGTSAEVLAMRRPRFTALGWLLLLGGFLAGMYAAILVIVTVLGIDLSQYTPGPNGQSPDSGSAGMVQEAMFDIANTPWLFWLVFPSVALGAPIAEELIFRGQMFSALSLTRLGIFGTTLVTAALWALMHVSEPWLSVALIFVMGLVFGWMMYRFGSIWVTMACHAAWNSVYALAIFGAAGP